MGLAREEGKENNEGDEVGMGKNMEDEVEAGNMGVTILIKKPLGENEEVILELVNEEGGNSIVDVGFGLAHCVEAPSVMQSPKRVGKWKRQARDRGTTSDVSGLVGIKKRAGVGLVDGSGRVKKKKEGGDEFDKGTNNVVAVAVQQPCQEL